MFGSDKKPTVAFPSDESILREELLYERRGVYEDIKCAPTSSQFVYTIHICGFPSINYFSLDWQNFVFDGKLLEVANRLRISYDMLVLFDNPTLDPDTFNGVLRTIIKDNHHHFASMDDLRNPKSRKFAQEVVAFGENE